MVIRKGKEGRRCFVYQKPLVSLLTMAARATRAAAARRNMIIVRERT